MADSNGGGGAQNNPGNFANDREKASRAGKEAHRSGSAHEFDSQEASEAGRKGGKASGNSNTNT